MMAARIRITNSNIRKMLGIVSDELRMKESGFKSGSAARGGGG